MESKLLSKIKLLKTTVAYTWFMFTTLYSYICVNLVIYAIK